MKSLYICLSILISCQKSLGADEAPFGELQSPIDLEYDECNCSLKATAPLRMYNYDSAIKSMSTLKNTGDTAEVDIEIDPKERPGISGGPLGGPFTLQQFHFHWGRNNKKGSEHTVKHHKFGMEIHLVHYRTEYGSFDEAMKHEDGLTVVAFFVKVPSLIKRQDLNFDKFTKNLKAIRETGSSTEVASKPFNGFQDGEIKKGYFTYRGSLTTPPYTENVRWIVVMDLVYSTNYEVNRFRKLRNGTAQILENWRPIQPTNGREVCYIKKQK